MYGSGGILSALITGSTSSFCLHFTYAPFVAALQESTTAAIMQQFGSGKLGSMMALSRLLFTDTGLWIYGGFIRDAVVRGEVHAQMDLDVGIPLTGMNVDQGMSVVSAQAKTLGMHFLKNGASTDPRLRTCVFRTADGSDEFEVQVCKYLQL